MAVSSIVVAGNTILVADLNNLREDVLDEVTGHKHTGASDAGRKVDFADAGDLSIVTKTADQTLTMQTTLQNATDMVFAVGANELWIVEYHIIYSAGNTPDIKFGASIPASATMIASAIRESGGTTSHQDVAFGGVGAISTDGQGDAQFLVMILFGHIDTAGTAGNVQLQLAQQTSSAGATIMK